MTKIKFGTDGWRAIIARDFTEYNVMRAAEGTAQWVLDKKSTQPSVVIGYDCRFGGEMFMKAIARVFAHHKIKCFVSQKFVSTPMVSLATLKLYADAGIVITASHNPPEYNGYKIKDSFGGPAVPDEITKIENFIPNELTVDYQTFDFYASQGLIIFEDLEYIYIQKVKSEIDLKLISKSGYQTAYDAMYGAGQSAMRILLPETTFLHCEYNPSFDGQAPEPIHNNLNELSELIAIAGDIDIGIATDGDADRIGLYDNTGKFVDSHHIILLLIQYLHKVKGLNGKVVNSFSCSSKITKLCKHYGLEQEITKIGFKYICDKIVSQNILIGGEESGGIAIKGHIPERDGIWIGLTILEFMSQSRKGIKELIDEIYEITGKFAVERFDIHIDEAVKQKVISACQNNVYKKFGKYTFVHRENLDGYKYFLTDENWVMIRPSGTEPVLRIYAEAPDSATAFDILENTKNEILN